MIDPTTLFAMLGASFALASAAFVLALVAVTR